MIARSDTSLPIPAPHPLEESERLAWQAEAAVSLLERFGELVGIALDAVGAGDDAAFASALAERARLVLLLEPLLDELAQARYRARTYAAPLATEALAEILRPVDEAVRYARLLHARLVDEVSERERSQRPPARRRRAALVS